MGVSRLRGRPGGRLPRGEDPSQARGGGHRAAVHPYRSWRGVRVHPGARGSGRVSMRPLDRLPSIRAKLGLVIVFAVGMTVVLVYLLLGYALRNSTHDTERLQLLETAKRAAASSLHRVPDDVTVLFL